MKLNINHCLMCGNLTHDIEAKTTPDGTPVVSFRLAINRGYGKDKDETDFHNFVAWRQSAEFLARYAKKGDTIFVIARAQNRSYTTKDGSERRNTEFTCDSVQIVSERKQDADIPAQKPIQAQFAEIGKDEELPF